jgi:hypothetical protein
MSKTQNNTKSTISRVGDKVLGTSQRLLDMNRLAYEADDMTRSINTTLYSDREKMIQIKATVGAIYFIDSLE